MKYAICQILNNDKALDEDLELSEPLSVKDLKLSKSINVWPSISQATKAMARLEEADRRVDKVRHFAIVRVP